MSNTNKIDTLQSTNIASDATDDAIALTDSATHKILQLLQEENDFDFCLRVFVKGGGCSGLQYHLMFDKEEIAGDHVITRRVMQANKPHAIRLRIDPISFPYLKAAKIEYQQDLSGEKFVIHNPNAKTTCGCGSSFSTD